jgi:hypothetical protein
MSHALVTYKLGGFFVQRAYLQVGNNSPIKSSNVGLARALNQFKADGWEVAHYGVVYHYSYNETIERFVLKHRIPNQEIPVDAASS